MSCQAFVAASNCLATRPHNYALGRPSVNHESLCNPDHHATAPCCFFLHPASLTKFVYLEIPAIESHIPQDESRFTRMKPSKSNLNTFNSFQNIFELDTANEHTIMSLVKPAGLMDLPPEVRQIIHRHTFTTERAREREQKLPHPLMAVCKNLRHESLQIQMSRRSPKSWNVSLFARSCLEKQRRRHDAISRLYKV